MRLQVAFKTRPLRDGGIHTGPRRSQDPRPSHVVDYARSKQHPYPDPLLEDIRQVLHPGHQHTTPDGQPFYLDLISQLANTAGDPDWQYPQILATGVPLGFRIPPSLHRECGLSRVSLREKTQWKLHWMTPRDTTITHRQQTSPEKDRLEEQMPRSNKTLRSGPRRPRPRNPLAPCRQTYRGRHTPPA